MHTENDIDNELSDPFESTIEAVGDLDGNLMILGAAGKMGTTLARMAQKSIRMAGSNARVIAVSRFSNPAVRSSFEEQGIETLAGDLLGSTFLEELPDTANVIFMAGAKFGTASNTAHTWAVNATLPGQVCQRFTTSRIACFSTGNIYGMVPCKNSSGSIESDSPNPTGEYAMSCLGRERAFEYFSERNSTPVSILRINYSTEYRYGVLVDLASKVASGEPINLAMGYFNVIWQRDACAMALESLGHADCPPAIFNITGAEVASVRDVCRQFGELMGKSPSFIGTESDTALLSNSQKASLQFGTPLTTLQEMIQRTSEWIVSGGKTWGKPTHFESRDGIF